MPGTPLLQTLTAHLQARKCLVVLDNCEHLIDECEALCSHLLGKCPNLTLLATSRERIGTPGEQLWRLAPMSLPPAGEAMMLGKPFVCYLRPEWLKSIRREQPDFVAELLVVSATPETVESVLTDLVLNPEKRRELGRRGREFALKWYSAKNAAAVFDRIYTQLLNGAHEVGTLSPLKG